MGGCASKPKGLNTAEDAALAPVETPVAAVATAEAETTEKREDGVETKKDEQIVDLSEPAPVKAEEADEAVQTETKPAEVEVVQAETKPVEEEKKEVA